MYKTGTAKVEYTSYWEFLRHSHDSRRDRECWYFVIGFSLLFCTLAYPLRFRCRTVCNTALNVFVILNNHITEPGGLCCC